MVNFVFVKYFNTYCCDCQASLGYSFVIAKNEQTIDINFLKSNALRVRALDLPSKMGFEQYLCLASFRPRAYLTLFENTQKNLYSVFVVRTSSIR